MGGFGWGTLPFLGIRTTHHLKGSSFGLFLLHLVDTTIVRTTLIFLKAPLVPN